MEHRIKIVIMSHLSDAQMELEHSPELANARLKFVRHLISTYSNTDELISIERCDEIWDQVNGVIV